MYIRRSTKRTLRKFTLAFAVFFIIGVVILINPDNFIQKSNSQITDVKVGTFGEIEETVQVTDNFKVYNNFIFAEGRLDVEDYREMKLIITPGKVVLADGCEVISVATSLEKTQRLARSIEREFIIRPEEHDLLEEILAVFEINVDYVTIDDLINGIFYGHIILNNKDLVLRLDSRPSDALNIASRFGAPIYVREKLLLEYAQIIC
tara:strand:+ start:2638 stop:3255 length:618 start_codon:yes stop_codon:yes gene_type:complete